MLLSLLRAQDYLKTVIQFGYVTLFASAFPLAPAICLVCNTFELFADSCKLMFLCRRCPPKRTSSIGGWGVCCYIIMLASIYTNLFIIGVASDQMAAIFPSMYSATPNNPRPTNPVLPWGLMNLGGATDFSTSSGMRDGMRRYGMSAPLAAALASSTFHPRVHPMPLHSGATDDINGARAPALARTCRILPGPPASLGASCHHTARGKQAIYRIKHLFLMPPMSFRSVAFSLRAHRPPPYSTRCKWHQR